MLTPLVDDDPRRVGPFAIHNRIGAGGMGTVYLGFNAEGRAAAVKVPDARFADDPEFRERFRREVAAARRVHGRAVAAVLDADPEAASPWLATEYVEGTSLADAVLRHGRMEERLLHGFGVGLADALMAIHAVGVVHRDLKPSNILLAWDGPKVIDFGIARALGAPSHTRTGILIGTLAWMAPEQLRGERAGPPADVFAWGACVTYAATGHPPFASEESDVLTRMREDRPPDIAGVPAVLVPLVRAALARRPQERPSAADLVRRLVSDPQVITPADADRAAAHALTPWQSRPPVAPSAAAAALDPDRPDQPTHPLALRPTPPPGGDRSVGTVPVPRWALPGTDDPGATTGAGAVLLDSMERVETRQMRGQAGVPAGVAARPDGAGGRTGAGRGGALGPGAGPGLGNGPGPGLGNGPGPGLGIGPGPGRGSGAGPGDGAGRPGGPGRGVGSGRMPAWAGVGWLPQPWRRAAPLAGGALLVIFVVGIVVALGLTGGDPQADPTPGPRADRTLPGASAPPQQPHGGQPPPSRQTPPDSPLARRPTATPAPGQAAASTTGQPSAAPANTPATGEPSATPTSRPTQTSGASPSGGPTPTPSETAGAPPSGCPTPPAGTTPSPTPPAC